MKTLDRTKSMSILLVTVFVFTCTFLSDTSLATTTAKKFHKAGRTASTSANTIHNGKGVPSNNVGIDGDFYINTLKLDFYGPKNNGHWPAPVSLKGPAGTNGSDGKPGLSGSDGKSGTVISKSSTTGSPGPQGPIGPRGIQGPQGVAGPQGIQGQVGPVGSTGANGEPGIPGAAGSGGAAGPTGATGPQGLTGATGSAGIQGLLGAQGVAGSNGATGATGPSQISLGTINFSQILSAGTGASVNSSAFGNFVAGKDYLVHLMVYGVRTLNDFASLRISVNATTGTPVIQSKYSISDGQSYRTISGEHDSNLDVYITLDGSSELNTYQLIVNVAALEDTSSDSVTLVGTYISQLVGSII